MPSSIWQQMLRRKPLEPPSESQLKRTLNAVDLVLYGVGSSVGAGIYCLVGIGAKMAGPGITISFACCGLACVFTSLAYAEFAARIPVTGSAYVYAYTTFGEVWGWLVGWNLTLGYGFAASVVARSWAEYMAVWLTSMAQRFAWSSLEASLGYLTNGAKESSNFNNAMTCFNIGVLLIVLLSGIPVVSIDNLTPFFPTGVSGVAAGAGLVFFAFIGFDMVACMSEEVIDPGRNMPIGIVGSLLVSGAIYVSISLVVVGMAPIALLGGEVPITNALLANGCCSHEQQLALDAAAVCLHNTCAAIHPLQLLSSRIVGAGAIFALTSATFVGLMGQPRIFYSMAKDGLLFSIFGEVDPETHVPTAGILITGVMCATLACFVDLQVLATVISLGTLLVFSFVDAAVIILRLRPWHEHMQLSERAFVLHTPEVSRHNSSTTLSTPPVAPLFSGTSWARLFHSKSVRDNGSKPIVLVICFAFATVLLSVGVRDSWPRFVIVFFGILSVTCCIILSLLPHSDPPETFKCPLVPLVPLLGMGANLFMAGALPNMSWILSMSWLFVGLTIYLLYGIHHSTLRQQEESCDSEEGRPLIISSSAHYNAIPSGARLIPPMALSPEER
ncbi:amino acid/polyamine antiporter [Fragilaria crotonensis]|nr:amino acid/polyamine antiporter [Fragilaria crotonensis]